MSRTLFNQLNARLVHSLLKELLRQTGQRLSYHGAAVMQQIQTRVASRKAGLGRNFTHPPSEIITEIKNRTDTGHNVKETLSHAPQAPSVLPDWEQAP